MAQLRIDDENRDTLRAMKEGAETYDDVIERLIEHWENTKDEE